MFNVTYEVDMQNTEEKELKNRTIKNHQMTKERAKH